MIPEIGHFALILALSLALLQGILPLVGAHRNDVAMMSTARTAAVGHLIFVVIAYACLTYAFLQNDFSVAYVANHSQLALPTMYKITAVWGGHEGSVLLWISAARWLDRRRWPLQPQLAGLVCGARYWRARAAVRRLPVICTVDVQSV